MRTVAVSKRTLTFTALAIVAAIAVILVVMDIARSAASDRAAATEAEAAAAAALSQALDLDYTEGREVWEARVAPLCAEHGWAFWGGPFFAGQVWPMVAERQYVTQNVEVVDTRVVGAGPAPDSLIVEATLKVTYTLAGLPAQAGGAPVEEAKPNQVVMVRRDGRWLMDTPPEQTE
jgi:hypothetical protein